MDKAHIAEWLLARVSTKRRATEIIGDLLETPQSPLAFWSSITRIFFALGSRILLAPLFALFSFAIPLVAFRLSANAWHHVPHHFDPWMRVSALLMIASMFLWTVPALALIRFGRRDPVTLIAFPLALLLTLSSTFAWLPLAFYGIAAAFTLGILVLCLHRTWRRSLLCILGTVATFALLTSAATRLALSISTIREHDNDLSSFLIWSVGICIEAWVLNYLHASLLPDPAAPAPSVSSATI
ncbi:hypothetical protein [Granulicella arctica]|uniref:hypothetical protein n=1 Tax=Granulicella arctica TaxID=940613 RepID=UPI0021E0934F|nr:hypothetical protein [Granulicella arctica]